MDPKKMRLIVVEDDKPVIPQLVPVTIRWVETDRAYWVTFVSTLGMVGLSAALTWAELNPVHILRSILAAMLLQTLVRAYFRYDARRKLDEMRKKLDL